jgi:hypothetical protein
MLDRFFSLRYGRGLGDQHWQFPDDDAGLADLKILVQHYYMNPMAMPRIIARHAPWADADAIIREVEDHPQRYSKKRLGQLLNFSGYEFRHYGIRTMTPVDMTDDQIAAYTKARREGKRIDRRRRKGVQERAEYLASNSLAQTQPWLAEGISRATWFRRRTKQEQTRETSVAPVKLKGKDQTCLTGLGLTVKNVKKDLEVVAPPPLRSPTSLPVLQDPSKKDEAA